MQVSDFMIQEIVTVKPSTTIKELIKILETNRIGGVPVVDDQEILVGFVSDGDIVRFLSPHKEKIYLAYYITYVEEAQKIEDVLREKMNASVEEIMVKKHIKTLAPDDDFESAIRLISQHHFKKLPVVDEVGKVVGIISRGDIIHNLSKSIFNEESRIKGK